MIKTFSGRVVFCFAIPEPFLLTLTKTDYPSIQNALLEHSVILLTCIKG